MPKASVLHELIHSLSMSEKRYFRLYAQQTQKASGKKYEVLFDAMLAHDAYDEEAIRGYLRAREQPSRYFSAGKRYLYMEILQCLRLFHAGKSARLQLKEMLAEVEILYKRGLHLQCLRRCRQALKIARQSGDLSSEYELIGWESRSLIVLEGLEAGQEALKGRELVLEQLRNLHAYESLHLQATAIRRSSYRLRNQEDRQAFEALLAHPLMENPQKALTRSAAILYHRIQASWFFMTSDLEQEFFHSRRGVELMAHESQLYREQPLEYIDMFSRLLSIRKFSQGPDFDQLLLEFQQIPNSFSLGRPQLESAVFSYAYPIQMARLISFNEFDRALSLLPEIEKSLPRFKDQLRAPALMAFYYGLAYILFANRQFSPALRYVNLLLNDFSESDRADLYHFTQLLNLFIHLELNNLTLLEYKVQTTVKKFRRRKSLYQMEKTMLAFFKRFPRLRSRQELQQLLSEMEAVFEECIEDTYERNAFNYFDFFRWLWSKKENCDFLQAPPGREGV